MSLAGSGTVGNGQQNGEAGVAGMAVDLDHSVVLLDEALGEGQAQAASTFPPRDQRIEDRVADLFRDPGAVVDYLQFQCQFETALGERDLARDPGAQLDVAAPLQRLRRIPGDVEDGLDQLFAIGGEIGQAGVEITRDPDIRELREHEPADAFEYVVDVERGGAHHAVRAQHPVHQVLKSIRFGDDHLGVFAQLGVAQFPLQQLRRTPDSAQRVLDLVRQVTDELAVGLLLLQQLLFAGNAQLSIDQPELEQQTHPGGVGRTDGTVEVQRVGIGADDAKILAGIAPVGLERVAQRGLKSVGFAEQAPEGHAHDLLLADGEQVLGTRIEVADGERLVDQHHC